MNEPNPPMQDNAFPIAQGVKMALPIVLGYLPLGFAFGVLAVKSNIPALYAVAMSVFIFAGSGQLIATGMIGMGAPIVSIAIANFMVNLRYMLMSAAIAPFLRSLPLFKRILFSFELTDEVFAVHSASMRAGASCNAKRLFACNVTAHLGWVTGTLLGVLSGEMVADIKPFGLDFALPAMFIALLVPLCFERLHLIVACLAVVLSLLFNLIGMGRYSVIVASVIAAGFGAFLTVRKEKKDSKTLIQKNSKKKEDIL